MHPHGHTTQRALAKGVHFKICVTLSVRITLHPHAPISIRSTLGSTSTSHFLSRNFYASCMRTTPSHSRTNPHRINIRIHIHLPLPIQESLCSLHTDAAASCLLKGVRYFKGLGHDSIRQSRRFYFQLAFFNSNLFEAKRSFYFQQCLRPIIASLFYRLLGKSILHPIECIGFFR